MRSLCGEWRAVRVKSKSWTKKGEKVSASLFLRPSEPASAGRQAVLSNTRDAEQPKGKAPVIHTRIVTAHTPRSVTDTHRPE